MKAERFEKLIALLKELFQLDKPELDFGFYRIMHARSAEVTGFLENELLPQVRAALEEYVSVGRAQIERELQEATDQARSLGVDPDATDKVKDLKAKRAQAGDLEAVEADVYDHLYRFFRRYYKDGDFISQRVYKDGVYAIPYQGEEVKLHWANADQYYIKTDEYLRNYSFRLRPDDETDPMRVHFRLADAAEGEHGNVKAAGDRKRVFVLAGGDFAADETGESGTSELVLRFEYRPAAVDDWPESERPGKAKAPNQETLLHFAEARILESSVTKPHLRRWTAALGRKHVKPNGEQSEKSRLRTHLDRYTARSTCDYFIHKDLGGFLRRELDFYIKNEVMHLDDIENETAPRVEQYLSKIRAIRRVAGTIIDFLAALEDFQKRLWLKKKFVVETSYCIRLGCIPDEFLPEIAANEAQRREWVDLCAIDEIRGDLTTPGYSEPLTVGFLRSQPTLMVDSGHFEPVLSEEFVAAASSLPADIAVRSENAHAIRLLFASLSGRLDCVHIDPPYNTDTSGFLYKNNYRHSTWIAMMGERLRLLPALLSAKGRLLCHIDENEYERLHLLLDTFPLGALGVADTLVWDKRNPMTGGGGVATQHEYVLWRSRTQDALELDNANQGEMAKRASDLIRQAGGVVTEDVRRQFREWIRKNPALSGGEKAYRQIDDDGRVFQSVSLRAPEPRSDPKFFLPLVHPLTGKTCPVPPNGFSRTPETLARMQQAGEIHFGKDETTQPRQKMYLSPETKRQLTSIMQDATRGHTDLTRLGLERFPYCHSASFYGRLLRPACPASGSGQILDYFAGSGTTGHAVINLNREDGGDRRFILVEMGEHFDTVLLPRLKKVTYSPEWKDGKPMRQATAEEAERSPSVMREPLRIAVGPLI